MASFQKLCQLHPTFREIIRMTQVICLIPSLWVNHDDLGWSSYPPKISWCSNSLGKNGTNSIFLKGSPNGKVLSFLQLESPKVTYGGAVRRAFTELSRVGATQVAKLAGDWRHLGDFIATKKPAERRRIPKWVAKPSGQFRCRNCQFLPRWLDEGEWRVLDLDTWRNCEWKSELDSVAGVAKSTTALQGCC